MRTIDADALMDLYANRMDLLVEHYGIDSTACGTLSGAMKLLKIQPTIEPKRETGEWISDDGLIPHCSKCGFYSDDAMRGAKFCSNCGVRMRSTESRKE